MGTFHLRRIWKDGKNFTGELVGVITEVGSIKLPDDHQDRLRSHQAPCSR
jgi:hypothetical protein